MSAKIMFATRPAVTGLLAPVHRPAAGPEVALMGVLL